MNYPFVMNPLLINNFIELWHYDQRASPYDLY